MTVQELIDSLNCIQDKTLEVKVGLEGVGGGTAPIEMVEIYAEEENLPAVVAIECGQED